MVIVGCGHEDSLKTDNTSNKETNKTETAVQKIKENKPSDIANKVADKIEMKNKIWTLEQIQNNKNFVAVAKDEVGTSYVYKPSIEVKKKDGKEKIEALVWRDYTQGKQLIKEEQEYKYDETSKEMELASNDTVYTYDGKFVEKGDERKMTLVNKDSYGYIMGQNILKIKNGESVTIK